MSSDRNLLFGILAVQMNFIGRDALIQAMNAWVLDKDRPLGDILVHMGQLALDRRQLLDALVNEHLKAHGNDAQQSIAALSSAQDIAHSLKQVADDDVQKTLAGLPETMTAGTEAYSPRDAGPRFRILRPHAQGGLGEVFVAEDRELHREVALKEIQARHADNPNSRGRFMQEAEVTGGLEHPGIVPVYGLGSYADGRPFYAMRFIRGDSLKEALERFHATHQSFDSIGFRQLLGRFQDVCNAIAYAHSRGILHRDLKPGNIMLGQYGETLVVDWGLAKPIGRDKSTELISENERTLEPASGSGYVETIMGSAIGTPAFMSPEQASGRLEDLGPASDVYSLGATLYVVLAGVPPFRGDTGDILKKVENGEFPPPNQVRADVPPALNAIVLKAMARNREDRYLTATALADEIERFLADEPVTAYREPLIARTRRWGRKHRTFVTTATATILLLLFGSIAGAIVLGDKNRLLAHTNQRLDEANDELKITNKNLDRANDNLTRTNTDLDKANDSLKKTNSDLDIARRDADAKRIVAEKARETTAEQRQLALDTVRDVLLRVDELMKNNTLLVPLRIEIIKRMLDDVDRIRDHALKNPLEDRTEAIAYMRMGEIYFNGNRILDAVSWLTKSHKLLKSLVDEHPDDPAHLRNYGLICHKLADAEWRFGHGIKARALHVEGLHVRQKRLAIVEPNGMEIEKADASMDVAESLNNVAYADLRLGDPKQAVENYLASDKMFENLPPPLPNFIKVRRMRFEIQVRLGDAQSKLHNLEQAQKHYLNALADRETMLKLNSLPRNANLIKTDVGQSRVYLGDFHLMIRNDPWAADEQYQIALDLFAEALKNEPDSLDLRQRVGASHYRLGITAGRRGPLALLVGATAELAPRAYHYAECLRLREELAKIDKTDAQGQVELLLAYARLGRTNDVDRTADNMLAQAGNDPQVLFQTACGYAIVAGGTGEVATRARDQAFRTIERLLESGWKDPVGLETDPDMEAIRGDKRFVELLKKLEGK